MDSSSQLRLTFAGCSSEDFAVHCWSHSTGTRSSVFLFLNANEALSFRWNEGSRSTRRTVLKVRATPGASRPAILPCDTARDPRDCHGNQMSTTAAGSIERQNAPRGIKNDEGFNGFSVGLRRARGQLSCDHQTRTNVPSGWLGRAVLLDTRTIQGVPHVPGDTLQGTSPACLFDVKALQFIQAEKMFYEVALIELTALQGAAGAQDSPASLGSAAWDRPEEELSELASQAQDYERLAQLCIMSKRPHLALEYSGKATKIRQKAFGNDHPITARSLELLASVYAEIGKTEYSDSLGQCVTALSKSMTPTEAFSHASRSTASSHRERRSDVRHHHRKEPHPLPEVPMTKITTCKFPPSILKRSNLCGSDSEATHRRRSERRVRFREPENIVHGYDASPGRPHLAPLACLFLLLSVLGVMLYCMGRRRPLRTCEELEAILAVCVLQVKQLVWGCWVWLTMQ
nr:uncharacterized protein LOC111838917 isoform X3 [Paramormyrops kingsleyae]